MTARELELIKEAFIEGMVAEKLRIATSETARYDYERILRFGIKIGEERGRGLAKRKPLKDRP